jgi:hypothetical protein
MKKIPVAFWVLLFISSCSHKDKPIVNAAFADSLITHYSPSQFARTIDSNLVFWEKRMDSLPENFLNGPKYASALSSRFHLYGDINDLVKADSLYNRSNEANQEKEPGIFRTLASFAMLQHRFQQADTFLQRAIKIENSSLPNSFLDFDVSFERGQYQRSKILLQTLKKTNDYGYLFRRSKFEHYDGSLDSAISCMLQAAEKAGNNNSLTQIALSNAADLYIHKGNLQEAYKLYTESIKIDAADLHSIMGIGWIALVHDKNDSLAEKIFRFVHLQSHAPDAFLKLEQLAEARGDSAEQKKWANEFAAQASQPVYGLMYSKYLIDLYTGILNEPAKALAIAEKEIINRPTPQTYAWYVWSLFNNDQKEKAYSVFRNTVSGKPLEGPELYYMGKMMQGLNKGYNAQEFFKAAYKNHYDLSPAKQKDLEKSLE